MLLKFIIVKLAVVQPSTLLSTEKHIKDIKYAANTQLASS